MRIGLSGNRRLGRIKLILFCALLFLGIVLLVLLRLGPVFFDYAEKYADIYANELVNEAVQSVYANENYSNLSEITNGDVKTVETDTAKINRLKSELNQTLYDKFNDRQTVYVPIGSITGFYFLAGGGPKIPVKICPVSVINTDLRDEVGSAGINQIYHKIYIDVTIEMSYVGLMMTDTKTVKTTTLVSETIIVGDTPQYYGSGGEFAVQ